MERGRGRERERGGMWNNLPTVKFLLRRVLKKPCKKSTGLRCPRSMILPEVIRI